MMALGEFVFGINDTGVAPDEFDRSTTWSWPQQDAVGHMSHIQFTGQDPDILKIPGVIYPGEFGFVQSLDELRAMAESGQPYLLVDIDGWVRGKWSITTLHEKRSHMMPNYAPRKIEFTLELKRYA